MNNATEIMYKQEKKNCNVKSYYILLIDCRSKYSTTNRERKRVLWFYNTFSGNVYILFWIKSISER